MAKPVQLERSKVKDLYAHLGWVTAEDWGDVKLRRRLERINKKHLEAKEAGEKIEFAEGEEDLALTFTEVTAGFESGVEFEIVDDFEEEGTEENPDDDDFEEETTEEETEDDDDDFDEETPEDDEDDDYDAQVKAAEKQMKAANERLKSVKKAKREKLKEEKQAAKKAKAAGPKGIRLSETRSFHCGRVLANHPLGDLLKSGITDELVAEVNTEFKKENNRESRAMLVIGLHILRGQLAITDPDELEKLEKREEAPVEEE